MVAHFTMTIACCYPVSVKTSGNELPCWFADPELFLPNRLLISSAPRLSAKRAPYGPSASPGRCSGESRGECGAENSSQMAP
jgi:hypothetical protein